MGLAIVHRTTWWVSGLCSIRIVTSSATTRCRAPASLSSSRLLEAWIAMGSGRSGSTHGSMSAGRSFADRVSDVSACDSLLTRTSSPAMPRLVGRVASSRGAQRSRALVVVVVGVTLGGHTPTPLHELAEVAGHVDHVVRAQRAGETRTSERRPTYRSLVVRMTSATRGPSGSQARLGSVAPTVHMRWVPVGWRRGEALLDDLEDLLETHSGRGGDRDQGEERPLRHRGLEVLDDRLGRDVLALEIAVEERVVLGLLDDRLDEGLRRTSMAGPRRRRGPLHPGPVRRVEHPLAEQPHRPDHDLVGVVDGQVQRLRVAEGPLA